MLTIGWSEVLVGGSEEFNVNWTSTPCFFSPTVLFKESGDKRDSFLRISVFP